MTNPETSPTADELASPETKEQPEIEVHEMGEDGDSWLVTGTTAVTLLTLVRIHVAKWLVETLGVEDGDAVEKIAMLKDEFACYTFRDDWVYVPINDEFPDDECYLMHGDEGPASLPRFAGTLVQL